MVMLRNKIKLLEAEHPDDEESAHPFQEIRPGYVVEPMLSETALVGCLRDGRLRVYSPFAFKFIKDEHHIVAEAVEFNEFGFGQNRSEALADLQRAIAELYFTLEKEQDRLGSDLQNLWSALQQKIKRR